MTIIADTGPLSALFNERDRWHSWAVETSQQATQPFVICEAVITETFFLLRHSPKSTKRFTEALQRPEAFRMPWSFEQHHTEVMNLYSKYSDVPSSFVDMCILHMASTMKSPIVWTTDHHFQIYRLRGKEKVPTITPE
ncbi:MAG: type II toxin-antitoxin system VapC family toxin [Chthoniobacterales bacterium]